MQLKRKVFSVPKTCFSASLRAHCVWQLRQQREEFQRELDEQVRLARTLGKQEGLKQAAEMSGGDTALIKSLQDEKRILEQQLAKVSLDSQVLSTVLPQDS